MWPKQESFQPTKVLGGMPSGAQRPPDAACQAATTFVRHQTPAAGHSALLEATMQREQSVRCNIRHESDRHGNRHSTADRVRHVPCRRSSSSDASHSHGAHFSFRMTAVGPLVQSLVDDAATWGGLCR